jgi:hypothetical protein
MILAAFRGILFSSFLDLSIRPSHPSLSSSRIPYINHTPLSTPLHPHSQWRDALPSPTMEPPLLPTPPSQPTHGHTFRRWRTFIRSSPLRSGAFFGALIFASLVVYMTLLSPHGALPVWHRPPDWHGFSQNETSVPSNSSSEPTTTAETSHPSPSPSPISDVLTVEQIRDIVAPTRGFFTRDYSLGLGWNNVSVCGVLFDLN